MTLETIVAEAMKLPSTERIELARRLWDAFDEDEAAAATHPDWIAEIDRRIAKHEAGLSSSFTLEEVVEHARKNLAP